MWRLKQFMPKDQTSLEGKSIDAGSLKLQIRNVIAQGGFSSVYLARDAQTGKNFALKHIIVNDAELLDLVRKEVSVMQSLKGHPNVVTLHAHTMIDTGRTKDCFLVMDFCEKTLVNVLDSRGAGYFDEKQLLLTFRDVCNAVYGMHSLSPPIAHRDLKAENLLMGPDGLWKLCDFGSTSTNHKRFETPEEMGVEEDNIRKHTTPAYRAPEMWDLYRRERISEKVDIWALGCLLYRMAYFKSAFDGESKLQILNGNYRIPDAPRYSNAVVDLIKDMLVATPESRPDIMQVWRRVNDALPAECRKASPDKAAGALTAPAKADPDLPNRVAPSRSPPPPPTAAKDGPLAGSFWSTQFAKEAKYDGEPAHRTPVDNVSPSARNGTASSGPAWSADFSSNPEPRSSEKSPSTREAALPKKVSPQKQAERPAVTTPQLQNECKSPSRVPGKAAPVSNDGAFNSFVAEFSNAASLNKMQEEVNQLKQQLQQALAEKADYVGKYEKLTAICRSQRQELQELKAALSAAKESSSLGNKEATKPPTQATSRRSNPIPWRSSVEQQQPQQQQQQQQQQKQQQADNQNGSIWELQDGLSSEAFARSTQPTADSWQAFGGNNAPFTSSRTSSQQQVPVNFSSSITNGRRQQRTRAASMSGDSSWDFIQGSSMGVSESSLNSDRGRGSTSFRASDSSLNSDRGRGSTSFRASEPSSNKPVGWAGF